MKQIYVEESSHITLRYSLVSKYTVREIIMTVSQSNYNSFAMWEAVYSGDSYSLKKVLKSGVNPNVLGYDGEPLLFTPIVHGDLEILKVFLSYCDVNIESKDGRTALMLAVQMGDMEMVKALIKAGLHSFTRIVFLHIN